MLQSEDPRQSLNPPAAVELPAKAGEVTVEHTYEGLTPCGTLAALIPLALGVFVAGLGYYAGQPPRPVPATAAPALFSAERALGQSPNFAQEPHPAGSEALERVRDYLLAQLTSGGVETQVQETAEELVKARQADSDAVYFNVVGRGWPIIRRVTAGRFPGSPGLPLSPWSPAALFAGGSSCGTWPPALWAYWGR